MLGTVLSLGFQLWTEPCPCRSVDVPLRATDSISSLEYRNPSALLPTGVLFSFYPEIYLGESWDKCNSSAETGKLYQEEVLPLRDRILVKQLGISLQVFAFD